MTILAIDGFDLYNGVGANTGLQTKWATAASANMAMIAGRFGGQAFQSGPVASGNATRSLGSSNAQGSFGFALRFPVLPATALTSVSYRIGLLSGGTWTLGMQIDSTGAINVARATGINAGTQLGVSAGNVIKTNTWHYVEVEFVISDTVGRITVYVDGAQVINVTNADTNNAVATIDSVTFGSAGGSSNSMQIDDLYFTDTAAKLGERRVETVRPAADTAQKDFTPSTGVNNSAMVDDTTADATDYVQASTVGNLDLYDMGDLSSTPATIDAVQYSVFALKTDANARNMALVGDVAGTQQQTADMVLTASANKYESVRPTKPGGGAWNAAAVAALKLGPKVTV